MKVTMMKRIPSRKYPTLLQTLLNELSTPTG
jgi:hypothetical protein